MRWEAPAKVNLSLHVDPPRDDGRHPLESIVQTVDWLDYLSVEPGEGKDSLESEIEDNIILTALRSLREGTEVPPVAIELEKTIPMQAGLAGGSSNAAAVLRAAAKVFGISGSEVSRAAAATGADVPLFLDGGTQMMTGTGSELERLPPLDGFALAVVVPDFGLSTSDVYRRWDELEGPVGEALPDHRLPPALRGGMPMRNDLLPAALDLEPLLGDFLADLRASWETGVSMTGSGSACFGYFPSVEEAADAVAAVEAEGRGVELRPRGVTEV